MPSIDDVARKAGVSTATVSRSFRSPALLSDETQQRVLDAASQLNYRPRGSRVRVAPADAAPDVARTNHETIGFQFCADRPEDTLLSNAFYAEMLMGAQDEAVALGLNMLIHTTDRHRLTKALPKMVQDQAISGMLLVGTGADPETLAYFAESVPHLILLDDRDPTGRIECVTSDGFGGAREATNYLMECGHRRIGFFLGEENVRPFQQRLHGYISALFDAGIVPDPNLIIGGEFDEADELRTERVRRVVQSAHKPTALLVANDQHAFDLLRILRRLGLQVPDDISVIGFDDIPFCTHTDPPLTTVRVDKANMGRLGVRRLYAHLHSGDGAKPLPAHNELPVSLVIRQSCRRL
jgi:DNA-binding LacI/PurR family transcriptional regulator